MYSRGIFEKKHEHLDAAIINIVGVLVIILSSLVRIALASFTFRRQPKPQWDVIVFRSMQQVEELFIDVHDRYDCFEFWVKQVNRTKMAVMQSVQDKEYSDK